MGPVALVAPGHSRARRSTNAGGSRRIAGGVLLSLPGIASMSAPIVVAPDLNSDGRTIALAVAGSFGGVVAAVTYPLVRSNAQLLPGSRKISPRFLLRRASS
jgi:hypothetical protein